MREFLEQINGLLEYIGRRQFYTASMIITLFIIEGISTYYSFKSSSFEGMICVGILVFVVVTSATNFLSEGELIYYIAYLLAFFFGCLELITKSHDGYFYSTGLSIIVSVIIALMIRLLRSIR
jgi:hypothetical protein